MIVRQVLPQLCKHTLRTEMHCSASYIRHPLHRDKHSTSVTDPSSSKSVSMSHPKDPMSSRVPSRTNQSRLEPSNSTDSSPSPSQDCKSSEPLNSNLPSIATHNTHQDISVHSQPYSAPPFHTHAFFAMLERVFPTPTARNLMRATRGLLSDRIGRVRREGLTTKDLDNQAYLFRAALSELRAELTMSTKNDSAAIRSSSAALRRDVDRLGIKMKEDIETLKHEIQMELDSRKNEVKADFKQQDIEVEELVSKSIVVLSDLRTLVEEIKWHNLRRAVVTLAAFVAVIIVGMELRPRPPPLPPPIPLPPIPQASATSEVHEPMTSVGDRVEWT